MDTSEEDDAPGRVDNLIRQMVKMIHPFNLFFNVLKGQMKEKRDLGQIRDLGHNTHIHAHTLVINIVFQVGEGPPAVMLEEMLHG